MKTEINFQDALQIEDCLLALENNYYDTHDLDSIREEKDELELKLQELKKIFGLRDEEYFLNYEYSMFKNKTTKN